MRLFTKIHHKNLPPPIRLLGLPIILLTFFVLFFLNAYYQYQFELQEHIPIEEDVNPPKFDRNLSSPSKVNNHKRKYLTYFPHSGFHNQRISLENAIFIAWTLKRTLVMPPIHFGKPTPYRTPQLLTRLLAPYSMNKSISDCNGFENERRRSRCVNATNAYTLVPWDEMIDFTFVRENIKIVHRTDFLLENLKHQLDIKNDKDIYFPEEEERYHYRIYDNPLSNFPLGRYRARLDIKKLQARKEKLIHFNSLHGTSRLVVELPEDVKFRQRLFREMVFTHPEVNKVVKSIVDQLSGIGTYIGLHARVDSDAFRGNVEETAERFAHIVNEEAKTFRPSLKIPKKTTISSACRSRERTSQKRLIVYIATDARNPRRMFSSIFRDFPCTFIASDFDEQFRPLRNLTNPIDGVKLFNFLVPIVDLLVAAHGGKFYGTPNSTFSLYAERVHDIKVTPLL